MGYIDSFIAVADDCSVHAGVVPHATPDKKKPVAVIQYELLADAPYVYTQEDVLFQTHVQHTRIAPEEVEARGETLREEFFATPRACLRASPLAKKYGWGFHFDHEGKVALCPIESSKYRTLTTGGPGAPTVLKALRSSRA